MLFGIIGWLIIGMIIGFIASKLVKLRGDDARLGIGVAAGGSIVFGVLYSLISGSGITAWNPWSLVVAAIGAIVGAVVWHVVRSRSISKEIHVPRRSY